jgi:hypothetical protein
MHWKSGSALLALAVTLAACSAPDQSNPIVRTLRDGNIRCRRSACWCRRYRRAGRRVQLSLRLQPARPEIAAAQETHAAACERLGVARCRITGMRYRLAGENAVEAMLTFKLDPTLARAFGKEGIAAIQQAEGRLVDAEITGTDAGAEIARLAGERARARDELARIDRELARTNLSASERAELQRQRADLVGQIEQVQSASGAQRESLANTPMTFDYRSGPAVRGFDASAPLSSALDLLAGSAQATLAFVLGALAILAPPGLVLGLGLLLWRWLRPRFRREATAPAPASD